MQNTLAESVIPAQRRHVVEQATETAAPLAAEGRDVVVERRRGGLPHYVKWLVVALDVLVIVAAIALAWPVRGVVPGVEPATSSGMRFSYAVSPMLLAL